MLGLNSFLSITWATHVAAKAPKDLGLIATIIYFIITPFAIFFLSLYIAREIYFDGFIGFLKSFFISAVIFYGIYLLYKAVYSLGW